MKQLTFKQYRSIDISIFCVLTAVFEAIATLASNKWFVLQAMTVSVTLVLTCIVMMRWGAPAALPSLIGSFFYCLVSGGNLSQYIIYCTGSIFCLAALPVLNKIGKEKVRRDFIFRLIFAVAVYISVCVGRWLVSLFFELTFESLGAFLATDILSLLFAIVVLTLAKNLDGLIEDQKSYLLRLERERQEEQDAFNKGDSF